MIPHPPIYRTAALLGLFAVVGCGNKESDGFLSESNVCSPKLDAYAEDATLDASEIPELLAGPASTRRALAQKTETAVGEVERWGLEVRLSSQSSADEELFLEFLTGQEGQDGSPTEAAPTSLPDGSFGRQIFLTQVVRQPVLVTTGAWIQIRFRSTVAMAAGDYAWVVLSKIGQDFQGDLSWNTVAGSGLMESTDGTTYSPRAGQLARYRFIDCK